MASNSELKDRKAYIVRMVYALMAVVTAKGQKWNHATYMDALDWAGHMEEACGPVFRAWVGHFNSRFPQSLVHALPVPANPSLN